MNKIFFLLAFLVLGFFGCGEDDDDNNEKEGLMSCYYLDTCEDKSDCSTNQECKIKTSAPDCLRNGKITQPKTCQYKADFCVKDGCFINAQGKCECTINIYF